MRKVWQVVGLALGDEGKGSVVDYLTRTHNATLNVRFNGGAQTAHNVINPEGKHHTFSQFGSGALVPGVHTHLSRFVLVNPASMLREAEHLTHLGMKHVMRRVTVDENAVVVTPFHRAANRIKERSRGLACHGTCGVGIGQARQCQLAYPEKVLRMGDLRHPIKAKQKLHFLQDIQRREVEGLVSKKKWAATLQERLIENEFAVLEGSDAVEWCWQEMADFPRYAIIPTSGFADLMERHKRSVFEGAQGVLLDETYGTAPHNTWTDTTFHNATRLLSDVRFNGETTRYGVVRAYYTRHGAGPFPTEDRALRFDEPHNNDKSSMAGAFRFGHFDVNALCYALTVTNGVDRIAINHMDQVEKQPIRIQVGRSYELFPGEWLPRRVEALTGIPVGLLGYGPKAADKLERSPDIQTLSEAPSPVLVAKFAKENYEQHWHAQSGATTA